MELQRADSIHLEKQNKTQHTKTQPKPTKQEASLIHINFIWGLWDKIILA